MERFKKGPWSSEEDAVLRDWVDAHGPQDWSSIQSKGLLRRTGKSCRLRWVNILRPGLKKGRKFSPEEEEEVVRLQAQFGNRWARIAEYFPGRTDNDVKNLWSTRKKRLARRQLGLLPSISQTETSVKGPEMVVPPNEVHTCVQTLTDDQQQDNITPNYQETIGIPYINQRFKATSATPSVLTRPTDNNTNTTTTLLSAPPVQGMQRQQCLNATSAAPVPSLPTSNPPNTKSEPSSVPSDCIIPQKQCPNFTSLTPAVAVPPPNTPVIKSGLSSTHFNVTTPQNGFTFFDSLYEAELFLYEPNCFLSAPSIFYDLTASVFEFFDRPHVPDLKV